MQSDAGARDERSTIVVADALAARQWEMHLAAAEIRASALAWETPPVMTYAAWLESLWLERGGAPTLTSGQVDALWRKVLAESAEGSALIGHAGAAQWAREAWRLLAQWGIDVRSLRAAGDQIDFNAFLSWSRDYRRRLDEHGWIDAAELEARLAAGTVTAGVVAADLDETYPARAQLWASIAAAGGTVASITAPRRQGTRQTARLADAAEELRAALEWARRRLAAQPNLRVAVVVPGAPGRRDEIDRQLAAAFGEHEAASCFSGARLLAVEPALGAAVAALTLGDSAAPYSAFGRWLRSPFFGAANEAAARAKLDRRLRRELRSQLPFMAAYRTGVAELLAAAAPESAAALAAALEVLSRVGRATPSRWAHLFTRCLLALGWQPPLARAALLGWQTSLDALARLTPIVGEVRLAAAVQELERILTRAAPPALPLAGVHVLSAIEDVGPGYDAVWVAGFTDAVWPEPPHGNPLLPLALQRAHEMPYSSPRESQARSARKLERLVQRSGELVISWPARVYDYETEPSPAIRAWSTLGADELAELTKTSAPRSSRTRETVSDPAPPFTAARLPGGTGALVRQARCPIRAFCRDRLGAEALERLALGVSPRLRGIATHRAAELLAHDSPRQAELVERGAAIPASAERALARIFGAARRRLPELFALEAERLERVLQALLRQEARRAPFRVRAVEDKCEIALGRWTLGARVDRIDELADGTIAIIDYKTSERATSADWFAPRLRDAQVPLYACQTSAAVGAAVVARLGPTEASYSGLWRGDAFPGRPARLAEEPTRQLELWREQLVTLATEFAAGDVRIFAGAYDDAAGAYAPLTRIFEQLELARGTLAPW